MERGCQGHTKRHKMVFEEQRFCGCVSNPPKENKILINKDPQPWISGGSNNKRPVRDCRRPRKRWQGVDAGTGQTT